MRTLLIGSMLIALATPNVHAQQDRWLGRDKALHFLAGSAISAAGYALTSAATERRGRRVFVGVAVGLGAGAAKELRDRRSAGTPSWRDFAWTAAGAAAGASGAWLIDRSRGSADSASAPTRPAIGSNGSSSDP